MISLSIDTSTDTMVLMLIKNGETKDQFLRLGKHDHQALIIPSIDDMLKKNHLSINDVNEIVVGIGPGSYTGLRVGVMTAKMLGFAKNIPVKKISSLLLLSSGYDDEKLVWHDARNNLGFSAGYIKGMITRSEKMRHFDDLSAFEKNQLLVLKNDTIQLDGGIILKFAVLVDDVKALIPNYMRKTEAEVKLDS